MRKRTSKAAARIQVKELAAGEIDAVRGGRVVIGPPSEPTTCDGGNGNQCKTLKVVMAVEDKLTILL
jgi:hypothetical protein